MSSIRVPVLCAFGVGCLSSAALFGLWHADNHADAQSSKRARSGEVVTTSLVPAPVERRADVVDDSARGAARAEPARVETADRVSDAKDDPVVAKDVPELANASPPPGGSAVSDVLMDLEAAYRQRLIAAARAEAAARADAEPTPDRATTPPAPIPAEPPREVATRAPAVAAAPAAPPAPVAIEAAAPPPIEAAPPTPPVPAAPVIVAQNDTRPVHFGDVNQNTYITNVRQGDVYVIQQQLAMLNYMQMTGMAANPAVPHSPYAGRSGQHAPPQSQFRQFPSTLTNLDNPWGFNFAPPNLVH